MEVGYTPLSGMKKVTCCTVRGCCLCFFAGDE